MKSLFRKLDVKNRTEAAVMAIRDGLRSLNEGFGSTSKLVDNR
ncbi:MAG: hypothetical protein M3N35_11080 [Candidatus Binatota bacterium]|nr:hypothetical protein [Candidatus Binatota bacterium]